MKTAYDEAVSRISAATHLIAGGQGMSHQETIVKLLEEAMDVLSKGRFLTARDLAKRWRQRSTTPLAKLRSKGEGPSFIKPGDGDRATVIYSIYDVENYEKNQKNMEVANG